MRFSKRLAVPSTFLLLFLAFSRLWRVDFKGNLISDFDIWALYHTAFYRAGILKPFLFWQYPSAIPVPAVTTYYEPLCYLFFALLLSTFGEGRVPFHLWAFFLHGLNTILVFFLSKELTGRRLPGLAAAAIFLLYPTNISVTSDLSRSLEHPMVVSWGLASLYCFLKFLRTDHKSWYGLSFIFFIGACFTKISALSFAAAVILLDIFLFGPQHKRLSLRLESYLPFILGGLLFAAIATWMYPWGGVPHQWGGVGTGIFPFLRLLEFNTWLLFPFYLTLGEPLILVLATFLIVLALLLWGNGWMRFLTVWILTIFTLFSFSNFRPLGELYKYMYISTVPFAMLVSSLIFHPHDA